MEAEQKPVVWVSYLWPDPKVGEAELKEISCGHCTFEKPVTGELWLLEYQVAECEPILLAAGFVKVEA